MPGACAGVEVGGCWLPSRGDVERVGYVSVRPCRPRASRTCCALLRAPPDPSLPRLLRGVLVWCVRRRGVRCVRQLVCGAVTRA